MIRALLTVLLTFFLWAVGVLAMSVVALLMLAWVVLTGVSIGQLGVALLPVALAIGLLLAIAAHELGHVLAGRLTRFRPQLVIIGPFGFVRQGAAFRPFRHRLLFDPPGLVVAYPADDRRLRARYAVLVGGGPLASILFAGLCLAAAVAINAPPGPDPIHRVLPGNLLSSLLGFVGLLNLLLAFGTLTPGRAGALDTDGKQLLEMLVGGKRAESRLLTLLLGSSSVAGVQPRNWDATRVARLLAVRDGSTADTGTNLLGYYHALDSGQVDRAGELLDLALAQRKGCLSLFRPDLLLEGAYYEGYHRKDAAAARLWLGRVRPGQGEPSTRLRAEAAVLFAEGRYAEALRQAEAALIAALQSVSFAGEADWLCGFLAECRHYASAVVN